MTPFDWILLLIAAPWALLNFGFLTWALLNPRVRTIELKGAFLIPLGLLLVVAYRVWG